MKIRFAAVMILTALALGRVWSAESGLHKKISMSVERAALTDALRKIEEKCGVKISYTPAVVKGAVAVTCKVQDKAAGRILNRILRMRGLRMDLSADGSVTVVRRNWAADSDKNDSVFEFAKKPSVRLGKKDRWVISFETKAFCDCTIAVENKKGEIIRHLASGVLGINAPEPFVWNSKKQTLVWDGKDDQGRYAVSEAAEYKNYTVRVSLGLKPRYERTLFWSPHKRIPCNDFMPMLITPAKEGVYVYDGGFGDHVRLFDHRGNYIRTIYPLPHAALDKVTGVRMHPDSRPGDMMPLRWNADMATYLTMGMWSAGIGGWPQGCYSVMGSIPPLSGRKNWKLAGTGASDKTTQWNVATAMAQAGGRVALARFRLNRVGMAPIRGEAPMHGPDLWIRPKGLSIPKPYVGYPPTSGMSTKNGKFTEALVPDSIALSPDGKWLYATAYRWGSHHAGGLHGVMRMPYNSDKRPECWLGSDQPGKHGTKPGEFRYPVAVRVDGKGRVYVCDYMNFRIQVFSSDGKLLKILNVPYPAELSIDKETGELFVFSWYVPNKHWKDGDRKKFMNKTIDPQLFRYSGFPEFKKGASYPLPVKRGRASHGMNKVRPGRGGWVPYMMREVAVAWGGDKPVLWVCDPMTRMPYRSNYESKMMVYEIGEKKLQLIRDFNKEAQRQTSQWQPPNWGRMRVYVNPDSGNLYVSTGGRVGVVKSTENLVRVDPETGSCRLIRGAMSGTDMAFDAKGFAYFRTLNRVVRFEPTGGKWREVPFDYGEEQSVAGHKAISALLFPGSGGDAGSAYSNDQYGGIGVSLLGHVAVAGAYDSKRKLRGLDLEVYPGRAEGTVVSVFDKHGKPVDLDAFKGVILADGIRIDKNTDLYVQVSGQPTVNGKLPENINLKACTLIKAKTGDLRIMSPKGVVPLSKERRPERRPDFVMLNKIPVWVEGAQWMFGGVGLSGRSSAGSNCHCHANARFDMDFYARSFASEVHKYRVVVLDTNGNVITRIGRCGNVDEGKPLVKKGGPPNPRSIGGDEVALMNCLQLAVHTDKRLFLSDIGNYCVRSVKLGYHVSEVTAVKSKE